MALLHFDGFETYYDANDFVAVTSPIIDSIYNYNFAAFSTDYGRHGRGVRPSDSSSPGRWTLVNNYTTFILGVAARLYENGTPSYFASYGIFKFWDESTVQLYFPLVGDEIQVRNGDNTLLGTTSGAGLDYLVWRYIEVKFTIDNSSGSVEIRSNGTTVLNLTSQDTQNTANAYINKVELNGAAQNLQMTYDDMYFLDTTGSKNNDFLGDVRADVIRPDGAGTYTQFTPSAGSNYENVDDDPYPDDDTTYNDGSTPGNKDSYALSSLSVLGTTIHGVKSQITVRKTDAGSKNVKLLTRAGTTDELSDSISLSDSYTTSVIINEDNPDDSAAWEEADVNAMEVGLEIVTTTTTTMTTTTTS